MLTRTLLSTSLALVLAGPAAAAPLAWPVHHPGDALAMPCYSGEVLEVQLAPAAARAAHPASAGPTRAVATSRLGVPRLDALAAELGATFVPEFAGERAPGPGRPGADFTAFHVVHLPPGVALEDAIGRFAALPEVASVSPIAILPTTWFPNDSLFGAESWLYDTNVPRHDIEAPEAWAITRGDTSIVIAILDTGVLAGHPDLGGAVPGGHGNLWQNPAEVNGQPGVDDDGNGFVDDTWGWDFVTGGTADGIYGDTGEDTDVQDPDPDDFAGHGTIVAGIAGAVTDNVAGLAGVAPTVRLMTCRVGWLPQGASRPNGAVRMDFVAEAIRYATRMGAAVINCSFASAYTAGLDSALTAAYQAGSIVVSASGNYSSPNYMATRPDVISVGATDGNDVYWAGTETGPWLDLVARGYAMCSTYIQTTTPDSIGYRTPDYVGNATGTSMAAPVVSGVIAIVQAYMRSVGQQPLLPGSMLTRLRQTGDDVSAENPGQPYLVPRVNLYRALTDPGLLAVGPAVPPRTGLVLAPRTQPARGVATFDWAAPAGADAVVLALHDLSGRRLREVTFAPARAGSWTWDGRDGASRLLPAGMYFARLSCGSLHAEARVVLLH